MDVNNGRMVSMLSPEQLAQAGPIQFVALMIVQRILEMNQRLVQGIGCNWSMIDQFHNKSDSLKEN